MTIERAELAIIGAGPAGLEAAITAAENGAQVTVIDSAPQPGGQYFKQPPPTFRNNAQTHHQREAQALLNRLSGVRLLTDTLVWGAFPTDAGEWLLTLHGPDAPYRLQSKLLILATGAYDRPIAFPGWTLPGVITTGAAQNLLKSQFVLPGRRILLAGTGPLQLAVAANLVKAGAEVIAVLEGTRLAGWPGLRRVTGAWGQWRRLAEGCDYWRTLRRAGVPLQFGWSVLEAHGDDVLQEVVITQLTNDWQPLAHPRQTTTVDTLVLGYGFIPSTQLSRLLGCQHEFRPALGGYIPVRDYLMQTSLPGVYAAGDGAGVGGAALARLEGSIAGLAAARQLGKLAPDAAEAAVARQQRALVREGGYAQMLGDLFTPGPDFYTLATAETIICRCEEVRLADIQAAVTYGAQTVHEVKGLTRCGMGNCQGRICGELVARAVARERGLAATDPASIEAVGAFTVRPPLHPLPLSVLAEAAAAD